MIHHFEYDGQDSREYKVYFLGKKQWKRPERDVTITHIPGRSGDIIFDNGCYKNFDDTIKLRLFASKITGNYENDFYEASRRVKDWLKVDSQYHRLIESYNPDYYRQIRIKSITIKQADKDIADITLVINCKPYMRRISGDNVITLLESSQNIVNPDSESSEPYMKITPTNGTTDFSISVNNVTYAFYQADGYVEIDSETMNVYKGTTNKNSDYAATGFPILKSGVNQIAFVGNINKIELVPRWRTL